MNRRDYLRNQLKDLNNKYPPRAVPTGTINVRPVTEGSKLRRDYLRNQATEYLPKSLILESSIHTTFEKSPDKLPFVPINLTAIFFNDDTEQNYIFPLEEKALFDTGAHCSIIPDILIPEELREILVDSCVVQIQFHGYKNVLETVAQIRSLDCIPNRSRYVILGQHELIELMTFTFKGAVQEIEFIEYEEPLTRETIPFEILGEQKRTAVGVRTVL